MSGLQWIYPRLLELCECDNTPGHAVCSKGSENQWISRLEQEEITAPLLRSSSRARSVSEAVGPSSCVSGCSPGAS